MMKWLLLAVVVVAVLWWLGRGRRPGGGASSGDGSGSGSGPSNKSASGTPRSQGPSTTPQPMVACSHCGVWLPKADALGEAGATSPEARLYCSEAHRRAGPGRD